MTCEEYQARISRLLDGELSSEQSPEVFTHLGTCRECRSFYHRLQNLNASLEQVRQVGIPPSASPLRLVFPKKSTLMQRLWSNRITVRLPVAAVLLLALALSLIFSVQRGTAPVERETVYLTKLPEIVVTANRITSQ